MPCPHSQELLPPSSPHSRNRFSSRTSLVCLGVLTAWHFTGIAEAGAATDLPEVINFNRHIRPILSNTCFGCHGADVKNNKGPFRLDRPEDAYAPLSDASGRIRTPLVPGKPEASEVWRRISSTEPSEVMPPKDALHQLKPREIALFKKWIEQGAVYQPHWAYITPQKSSPPSLANPAQAHSPVDNFLLKELETRAITPSPEADRNTLVRRVYLDLIGLPPTPAQVAEFASDQRPDAYERLVDQLLASPHYGERMAVPWLDAVRFTDTVGFHGDQPQNIFPYRDYVISAFNQNKPFDQFTLEQIAGDLIPNATEEQRVATGFNRLNMMTREGGAQPREYLAKYDADRVRAISTVWLGSTMGCAECHDHKFDPISTKDFYSMAAYFSDIKQWGVYSDYSYSPEPDLEGFNNDFPFPPEINIESPYLRQRMLRQQKKLAAHIPAMPALTSVEEENALAQWVAQAARLLKENPDGWALAALEKATLPTGVSNTTLPDGSLRFAGKPLTGAVAKEPHQLVFNAPAGPLAMVRLEVLPDEAHQGSVAREGQNTFTLSLQLSLQRAGESESSPITITDAYPNLEAGIYSQGKSYVSVRDKWTSSKRHRLDYHAANFLLSEPLTLKEGDRLIAKLITPNVGRIRLSVSPLGSRRPDEPITSQEVAAFQAATPTPEQQSLRFTAFRKSTVHPDYAAFLKDYRALADYREGRTYTMVTVATEPRPIRILPRGNWQDESGEQVEPAPPHFLPGGKIPEGSPRQTRLDLAHWLTSRENPLTARTFANRLWKQFFGTGLSAVLDDLGMQGEWPSHPELLDWLAVEFMESGWDVKALVRLIVTSAAYRQQSVNRPDLQEIDPANRLLARQTPRRLDAEFVRDNALHAASLLNLDLGGPSAFPYQPEGYYTALMFPDRDYYADQDDRQYRRGVYTHWQRTFLHPMLTAFDAPSREECAATRNLSSTPQQALTLLNDPSFVEAARVLAAHLLQSPRADFTARLNEAFQRVLARAPTARETESLARFHAEQLQQYSAQPEAATKLISIGLSPKEPALDPAELAAWTAVARVLLNLNESIIVY